MGLIIGPVILLWVAAFSFTLRMGYVLLESKAFFPYVCVVLLLAVAGSVLYVFGGLSTFQGRSELWAFEIPWFFLVNKYTFLVFALSVMAYLFGGSIFVGDVSKAIIFIVAFSIASGSLIGCFSSSAFMKKYNISETY